MSQIPGSQVMVVFNSNSASRRTVVGPATKTNYGYRKHGDKFKAFESDVRARPDLFRPIVNKKKQPGSENGSKSPVVAQAEVATPKDAPQPPPPPTLLEDESGPFDNEELPDEFEPEDEDVVVEVYLSLIEWDKINDRHIKILMDNKIATIHDVHSSTEEELLAIKGIGPVIAKELKEKGKEYPLVL